VDRLSRRWRLGSWDILIIADGSARSPDGPAKADANDLNCGWGAVLIDRVRGFRKTFYGGTNTGTSGYAELIPIAHALWWHDDMRWRSGDNRPLRVAIISDNVPTVRLGNMVALGRKRASQVGLIWSPLVEIRGRGYSLRFYWKKRASSALHVYCDDLAREARVAVERISGPVDGQGSSISIDRLNPDDL